MIKPHLLALLLIALIASCSPVKNSLLTKKQTSSLYDIMISDIEHYDAEMIATRNATKDVSWEEYKAHHEKKWNKGLSAEELKTVFYKFARGYLNGHSHLWYLHPVEKKNRTYADYESNIKLGYTYPDISFFNVETGKEITSINKKPIEEIFSDYSNYSTTKIRPNAVLSDFSSRFNQRYLKVDGEVPSVIQYEDGKVDSVIYETVELPEEDIFFGGIDLSGYEDWEIVEKGYKAALLKKDNVALIKIKNFIYMSGFGGEMDCPDPLEEIADSTMCKDVKLLFKGLESIKNETDYLIFDLQDNLGGNENTRFVKMFCPGPFMDTRVQFRKTELFEDPETRDALSYFKPEAEYWYQSLQASGTYDKVEYGDFLPIRGDFCEGDSACGLTPIDPNNNLTTTFDKIIVLTNHGTGSSADDFTFRFKEYGGAVVVGQPQSADLTYSLISVVYFIDEEGNLDRVFHGNAQKKPSIPGKEIFKIDIPYAKTIDKNGKMLQGNPVELDLLVPITPDNFSNIRKDVLDKAIEHYCK